jgi:argininosuccinate synthase
LHVKRVVLAFSGGLDTTFCARYLKEELGYEVITATVDTGGFSREELSRIERSARALGVLKHVTVDGKKFVYDRFISYIIKANALRGAVYPISVGAERVAQAVEVARLALKEKAAAVSHGSTGAGNDQIRFDVAFAAVVPDLEIVVPVRALGWSREREAAWLKERGVEIDSSVKDYSVNEGLWGTTIGGRETHDPWAYPPEEVFARTRVDPRGAPEPADVEIGFEGGLPVSLDGRSMEGLDIVRALNDRAGRYGIGRGVHIGDTILGIKGRIVFEAPAPLLLIDGHRELEKLVLSQRQRFWKDHLGQVYGDLLHEGLFFDPVMRDIEAMIDSSQSALSGAVRVRMREGSFLVTGVKSDRSVMKRQRATYGETQQLWDHRDAEGFSRIYGVLSRLYGNSKDALL